MRPDRKQVLSFEWIHDSVRFSTANRLLDNAKRACPAIFAHHLAAKLWFHIHNPSGRVVAISEDDFRDMSIKKIFAVANEASPVVIELVVTNEPSKLMGAMISMALLPMLIGLFVLIFVWVLLQWLWATCWRFKSWLVSFLPRRYRAWR